MATTFEKATAAKKYAEQLFKESAINKVMN
jgi:hypothetical protein